MSRNRVKSPLEADLYTELEKLRILNTSTKELKRTKTKIDKELNTANFLMFFWLRCFSDVFKSFNHFLNMFFFF